MPACRPTTSSAPRKRERIGCLVGSGIGGLPLIEDTKAELEKRGPRRITPFFVPGVDHQHDLGPRLDHVRLPGAEPGDRHRLHDRPALDRHGRPDDRARRCRRHDRRRRRGDGLAARRRRLRRGARALDAQRRPGDRLAPVGQGPRRLRPRRGRRRRWCSRSTSTPSGAARRSTPSWSASAWAPTPST